LAELLSNLRNLELFEQAVQLACNLRLGELLPARVNLKLEHGTDIVRDRQASKDGCLLWQVREPFAGTTMDGLVADVLLVKPDAASIWGYESHQHIKAGRLSCAIRPQQPGHLAGFQLH
jgi:hypothetical protein